jgi:hypothetical protein
MVDNINLNRISPLLSSAEHVKQVDRKQRDHQQPPFKGALKDGDKKKKKKKKKGKEEKISESISSGDDRGLPAQAERERQKQEKESTPQQTKKIIDIRV